MVLKVKYEAAEDIPAGFETLYTEKDGNWVLTGIEGLKTSEDTTKLTDALAKERKEHKATKDKLAAFKDLTPEQLKKDQEELEELRIRVEAGEGKMDKEAVEKLVDSKVKIKLAPVEKERDDLRAAVAEKDGTINTLNSTITRSRIETEVRKVAESLKVVPTAIDDAVELANKFLEVQEDGSIVTREVGSTVGGLTAKDWLEEMKDKRPHWWPASQGGGGKGGKDVEHFPNNPWSKEHENLTEQGRIMRADPKRAEQMKARANKK